MVPVRFNDVIILDESKTLYKIVYINYIDEVVTIYPIYGELLKLGHFRLSFASLKDCQVIGNTSKDPVFKLLYE